MGKLWARHPYSCQEEGTVTQFLFLTLILFSSCLTHLGKTVCRFGEGGAVVSDRQLFECARHASHLTSTPWWKGRGHREDFLV